LSSSPESPVNAEYREERRRGEWIMIIMSEQGVQGKL